MGHMMPCAKIAEAMAEAGHQVTFITLGTIKGKAVCPKLFDHTTIKYILHDIPECEEDKLYSQGLMDPFSKIMFPLWEPKVVETFKEI